MARPAVLVVDPEPTRRKELCHGLSAHGYEVVPAVGGEEGRRFAEGLGPSVVVAPMGLAGFGDAAVLEHLPPAGRSLQRTLLLLGESDEQARDLPEDVLFLSANGLSSTELVRRIRLVLLGREIDVEPDAALASLVGDLSLVPFLELVRALSRTLLTGRVVLDEGEVGFAAGRIVAAGAGKARGVKAFCRLARRESGTFRVLIEPAAAAEPEIRDDVKALVIRAIEDLVRDAPDPGSRLKVELGPAFFTSSFTPREQQLLGAAQGRQTVAWLLDALPGTDGEVLRDLLRLQELGVVGFDEPEARVRVVTDSTCDLPPDLARAHGIQAVPVLVLFGDRVYRDGVDIRPREFYELLEKGGVAPRTNPPGKGDFLERYRALPAAADVVSIHLSEKLSQTIVNARAAADEEAPAREERRRELGGDDGAAAALEVVDSGNVSLGLGLLALFAARMARRGLDAPAIASRLAEMRERVHVLFVVDTLEYLARGGRIGKARALLGGLLGIKPILGVVEGEVAAVDRVRGGRAAHPRIIEILRRRVDPARPVVVGVAHAKAPVWADRLRALVEQSFEVAELVVAEMGPVVGAHAGPGTVGAAVFQPTEEELPLIAPLAEG